MLWDWRIRDIFCEPSRRKWPCLRTVTVAPLGYLSARELRQVLSYLQVAFDLVDVAEVRRVLSALPESDHILIEVGTPLVKMLGISVVKEIRAIRPGAFIILDLKTLDTGNLEVRLAADSAADAVVISGLAPKKTLELSIREARKTGIYSIIDMLNVPDPLAVLKGLKILPDVVELHRAIDMEKSSHAWSNIDEIQALGKEGHRLLGSSRRRHSRGY